MLKQSVQEIYTDTIRSTSDTRLIESRLFKKYATRIALTQKQKNERFGVFAEALNENLRFWLVIATEVARDDNKLSHELRAGLLYLVDFTRIHTARVLADEATADVLVDINRSVAAGLRGESEPTGVVRRGSSASIQNENTRPQQEKGIECPA